ncbi:hypothetical protein A2U01_0062048, partial [Trifolium medium]|nr:hypothetical protein [Trifolium medium]
MATQKPCQNYRKPRWSVKKFHIISNLNNTCSYISLQTCPASLSSNKSFLANPNGEVGRKKWKVI